MVEEPNFEYKYDLAYRKSFAARLSFRIMGIAAGGFLVAVILFFYFTGDSMTLPLTHQIVKYGTIVFIVGLTSLFVFCTWAIYQMVRPLRQFTDSAISIAEGNLDAPLPAIHSEDELLQLRNSFEHMQLALKQYIDDLKTTTASKERLQSELKIAHDIQMGMIPTTFPQRKDLDLFASMTPAKEVGGDLYDFIIDGDELFFIIGDVAGKGVPASIYMAVTRTLFRNLAGNYQSAANIVREMNHAIASTNDSFIFVTVFVGVLDMKTHYLTYCNAAHNAPVMITTEGECSLMEVETNLPIGVEDRYNYGEQQVDFPPGSALLLYTDGLTEATYVSNDGSRKLFGEDRVLHDTEKNSKASAIEVIDFLKQHVAVFADGTEQGDERGGLDADDVHRHDDDHGFEQHIDQRAEERLERGLGIAAVEGTDDDLFQHLGQFESQPEHHDGGNELGHEADGEFGERAEAVFEEGVFAGNHGFEVGDVHVAQAVFDGGGDAVLGMNHLAEFVGGGGGVLGSRGGSQQDGGVVV